MQWQADWGLRMRMGANMLLLGALYLGFAGALTLYFPNLFYVACAMVGLAFVQLLYSDRLALRSMGARTVSESEYPELHRSVGRLAQQADLPSRRSPSRTLASRTRSRPVGHSERPP